MWIFLQEIEEGSYPIYFNECSLTLRSKLHNKSLRKKIIDEFHLWSWMQKILIHLTYYSVKKDTLRSNTVDPSKSNDSILKVVKITWLIG